jgi:hypothetical protein
MSLHVPAIRDIEVASGLSRRVRARQSSESDARDALADAVRRHTEVPVLP